MTRIAHISLTASQLLCSVAVRAAPGTFTNTKQETSSLFGALVLLTGETGGDHLSCDTATRFERPRKNWAIGVYRIIRTVDLYDENLSVALTMRVLPRVHSYISHEDPAGVAFDDILRPLFSPCETRDSIL